MRRLAVRFSFAIVAALGLASAGANNLPVQSSGGFWPQWRGPNRDAVCTETGLLDEWPTEGPPLAWKAEGMGIGFSGVTIADSRIFTTGDRGADEFVIALNLNNGKELWAAKIGKAWEKDPNGYPGARSVPTIDGRLLYALSPHGDLVCLATATGKEVWRRSLPKDFGGKMHSGWGYSESPLVDGDRLMCTPGGPQAMIVALDKKTGKDIWRSEMPNIGENGGDGAAYSSIVIGNGAGVRQYVQLVGRGVIGVAAKDGKFLWGYNKIANKTANIPTPVVNGDYVFCSTGYGTGAALLKLAPSDGGVKADEVYFLGSKDLQVHHGGMVMVGDYIYCGHGHNEGRPTCLEWKTGKQMWRHPRGPGSNSAAILYADNRLYMRFQDGTMALIAATPEEYQEKGTFKIPDCKKPSWPHPVIAGGKLYLREQEALLCYNIKK